MPVSPGVQQANLDRLLTDMASLGHPAAHEQAAAKLSDGLYLSHGASPKGFAAICQSGAILAASRFRTPDPECAEAILGTTDSVFFYAGPFRYPQTVVGLLYRPTLEQSDSVTGAATPFDSGGLVGSRRNPTPLRRPDPTEPARDFLARHELPLRGFRRYLKETLCRLFEHPSHYVKGLDPSRACPIGLTGGDQRRWTHEVRIVDQVPLRTRAHLEAVFVTKAVSNDPAAEAFLIWCRKEGVPLVKLPAKPRPETQFQVLQNSCIQHIMDRLY